MIRMRAVAAKCFGQDLNVLHAHIDAGVLKVTRFTRQIVVVGQLDDIGRGGFIVMRVAPLRHEAIDGDFIAGDVVDVVG